MVLQNLNSQKFYNLPNENFAKFNSSCLCFFGETLLCSCELCHNINMREHNIKNTLKSRNKWRKVCKFANKMTSFVHFIFSLIYGRVYYDLPRMTGNVCFFLYKRKHVFALALRLFIQAEKGEIKFKFIKQKN